MTYPRNPGWRPGSWKAICDICGFQFRSEELFEDFRGRRVCAKDLDRRNPQEFVRPHHEEVGVPWSRADTSTATGYKALVFSDSPYTISWGNWVFDVDCTSGAISITLPLANNAAPYAVYLTFTKTDSSVNAITLNRSGADTIDGATSKVLSAVQNKVFKYISNGVSKWEAYQI